MSLGKLVLVTFFFLIPVGIIISIVLHETTEDHIEKRALFANEYEARIDAMILHNADTLETFTEVDPDLDPLNIAIVWPISTTSNKLIEGVMLAADEINQQGGIFGQPIGLKFYDTKSDIQTARKIANKICDDEDIFAVIGHYHSYILQVTTFTYWNSGLLFITPGGQAQLNSLENIETFFRTIPNTRQIAEEAAFFTQQLNYRNPVIITEDDMYEQDFSKLYEVKLNKYGINPVYNFKLLKWKKNYRSILNQVRLFDHDLIVLAITPTFATTMLREASKMGLNENFMTLDLNPYSLASNRLLDSMYIYNLSIFEYYNNPSGKMNRFLDSYNKANGNFLKHENTALSNPDQDSTHVEIDNKPDDYAAYGYDTVMLLAQAIKKAKSVHSTTLATYLRYNSVYDGVTGSHDFDEHGNVFQKPLYLTKIHRGERELVVKKVDNLNSFTTRLKQELVKEITDENISVYSDSSITVLLIKDDILFNAGTFDIISSGRQIFKKIAFAARGNDSILIQLKSINQAEINSFTIAQGDAIADMETSIKASRITSHLISYGIKYNQIYTVNSAIKYDEIFPKYASGEHLDHEHVEILFVEKSEVLHDLN